MADVEHGRSLVEPLAAQRSVVGEARFILGEEIGEVLGECVIRREA